MYTAHPPVVVIFHQTAASIIYIAMLADCNGKLSSAAAQPFVVRKKT